jgi:hypothetical protein
MGSEMDRRKLCWSPSTCQARSKRKLRLNGTLIGWLDLLSLIPPCGDHVKLRVNQFARAEAPAQVGAEAAGGRTLCVEVNASVTSQPRGCGHGA